MTKSEAGRLGGRATLARYGRQHMRMLGKCGFRSTLARHWQGDYAGYIEFLHRRGWLATIERLADQALANQLAAGAQTACVELPVLDDDLDAPPW